ncbi:class I adenylate-forming enzyme family protein [Pseudomonas sp.]|uniref:class I adenylate-forming enzyme family protein n=1 Tax=Pseudomonas sp. TaxID=306 RepID=UPI002D01BFD6|nr:class I adenylate-forming enzyme family protein [Pseudomonas sp.]HUE91253.1 class I adenylate-forming enzyme family protein [Pseudomonas sp.]
MALDGLSPLHLATALVALDGQVAAMLLLPSALEESKRQALIEAAGCSHYLTADGLQPLTSAVPVTSKGPLTQWLLTTSGTTGTPKLIGHTLHSLIHSCKRDPQRGAGYVWGLLYDPARFAGLQVLLQALLAGSRLVLVSGLPQEQQVEFLLAQRVNAMSATPSLWRRLLMDDRLAGLPLRQITLGGEIADAVILQALRKRFVQARLVHIYASTEAGTGFAVKDGLPGFPAKWLAGAEGVPLLRVSAKGHLLLKPSVLTEGDEIARRLDAEGFLDSGDLVEQQGQRVLFLGRAGGAINVGGNKVNPEAVEAFLRSIDGVLDARVSGRSNSMMGQLVVAEVVPVAGVDTAHLRQEIHRKCRAGLEKWQAPGLVNFVERLLETAAGKRERTQP